GWLRNRIKVHVNVTNRVDASFWGGGLVSSVFGYPDDVMRDHRKIAFRDVGEDDPWGGVALLTGMGVGQQYLGPGWDDRSLVVQGPVLLQLKQAARELLLSQGLTEADLPLPFRAAPRAGPGQRAGQRVPPDVSSARTPDASVASARGAGRRYRDGGRRFAHRVVRAAGR